jgi:hypothetical protein
VGNVWVVFLPRKENIGLRFRNVGDAGSRGGEEGGVAESATSSKVPGEDFGLEVLGLEDKEFEGLWILTK